MPCATNIPPLIERYRQSLCSLWSFPPHTLCGRVLRSPANLWKTQKGTRTGACASFRQKRDQPVGAHACSTQHKTSREWEPVLRTFSTHTSSSCRRCPSIVWFPVHVSVSHASRDPTQHTCTISLTFTPVTRPRVPILHSESQGGGPISMCAACAVPGFGGHLPPPDLSRRYHRNQSPDKAQISEAQAHRQCQVKRQMSSFVCVMAGPKAANICWM